MGCVLKQSGEIEKKPQKILDELHKFYSKLYTTNEKVQFKYKNTSGIQVDEEMKASLEGKILMQELKHALKTSKRNKAPGVSGLPIEIYIVFFNEIKEVLLEAINYAYEGGKLHDSALKGIITLIPKWNRDGRVIANMWPITLLETEYKLTEKKRIFTR